jgi:hypothetical protein
MVHLFGYNEEWKYYLSKDYKEENQLRWRVQYICISNFNDILS